MRCFRRLFCDQRGTASLESVIMLPVMIVAWAGVVFRLQTLDATLVSANEARRSAWTASNSGCRSEEKEYDCNTDTGGADGGGWLDSLSDVPIVGSLFGSVFGYATTARVDKTVDVPVMFGGGTANASYGYYIMCNERPMTVGDLLMATICEQFSAMGVDLDFAIDCPPPRHEEAPDHCME